MISRQRRTTAVAPESCQRVSGLCVKFGLWKNEGLLLFQSRHLVPGNKKFKATDLECRHSRTETGREISANCRFFGLLRKIKRELMSISLSWTSNGLIFRPGMKTSLNFCRV